MDAEKDLRVMEETPEKEKLRNSEQRRDIQLLVVNLGFKLRIQIYQPQNRCDLRCDIYLS